MFTGIVQSVGRVGSLKKTKTGARMVVKLPRKLRARKGDSICVSGVCLTAVKIGPKQLAFDLVRETLSRTALGELDAGDAVNLEPSLTLQDPMGGHFVMGHVDGVGMIVSKETVGDGAILRIKADPEICGMLAVKGSVGVDGISLTVTVVEKDAFEIALIPHTLEVTTLGEKGRGDAVNVEIDMLARYVHAFSGRRRGTGLVDRELLKKAGFIRETV